MQLFAVENVIFSGSLRGTRRPYKRVVFKKEKWCLTQTLLFSLRSTEQQQKASSCCYRKKVAYISCRAVGEIFWPLPKSSLCFFIELKRNFIVTLSNHSYKLQQCTFVFLAVQDMSITDIVCRSEPTNNQGLGSIKK